MASILDRFNDIIKANVNALVDKMEDPSKMIDQYLREMMDQLAEVKRSTAGVMAQETSTKRLVDDNQAQAAKYADFAKKKELWWPETKTTLVHSSPKSRSSKTPERAL